MKYCPVCDAEFPDSHSMCSVCSIELVPEESRGEPLDDRQRNEKIVLAWRGGDPLAVSEVIHILRDAGIRHHVQPTNEHLVFELGMPRPKYAVRVFLSDQARAKELLANVRESAPFALDEPAATVGDLDALRIAQTIRHGVRALRQRWFGAGKIRRSPIFSKRACVKTESACGAKTARTKMQLPNRVRFDCWCRLRRKRHHARLFVKCAKRLRRSEDRAPLLTHFSGCFGDSSDSAWSSQR